MDLLWRAGVDPCKVVLGQAFYGHSYTLSSPSCNTPNGICQFTSGGKAGPCSQASGILYNREIQDIISQNNLTPGYDATAGVEWITWDGDQWASYDDEQTLAQKRDFASQRCLSGTMVWAIDQAS